MTASSHVQHTASRAADSKPLEYLARGGFVGYGIVHLLFAWLALQVALGDSGGESDQSGALQAIAAQPAGKVLVGLIAVGLGAMALWQVFEAAIGESGPRDRAALAERVLCGARAVLYGYFAWLAVKVVRGASASQGDSQEQTTSSLLSADGGRWLVGLIGLVVAGVGIGITVYGATKKFEKHLETGRMNARVRRTVQRLGQGGYTAKGIAYTIAGVLVVGAAVTVDPDKARGLDAALKTLAGTAWGPWLLGLIALGIAAFGVYCFFQARYRKV